MGRDERTRAYRLPDLDAEEPELIDYKNRFFNHDSLYRCRNMERMAMNLHYVLDRQWIELDTEVLINGMRGYVFKEIENNAQVELPRPVTNLIAPAVEVEMSSLGKRELTPTVLTTSKDPRIQAAAKVAKEILEYRLKVLGWPEVRELATYLNVVCGTVAIKSYWDETYADLTRVGSPYAASCPMCGSVLASTQIPKSALEAFPVRHSETIQEVPGDDPAAEETLQLTNCPHCEAPTPLQPYEIGPEEAEGADFMGRPLGLYVPKGNTGIEVVSPFDLFPENGGVGVSPESAKVWGQAAVRSLDWIEERYPEFCDRVVPDDPYTLMRIHPLLGEWSLLGNYDRALDSGIYENHALVFELYSERSYRFPEGRALVLAGDVTLENGTLYKSALSGVSVPRVKFAASRFKLRHGEFWGHGLVDSLISPQNQINGIKAQLIETRLRMGSPNLMASEAMDLSEPSWFQTYGVGKVMRYITDPLNPTARPEAFGGEAMPPETFRELEMAMSDMAKVAGPQDVEIGEAPRNISTTSGLQLLGEQAERRRAPRERALIAMFEKVWGHQLELLWALRTETDDYELQTPDDQWETQQFDRKDIKGQTKVKIEKQAHVDKSLYIKEATREAQADGLYRLESQYAIKKLLELRGLPTDVNQDLNYQVDCAKRQWVDFVDTGEVPTVDESLDDFPIHFGVLREFLLSDEGKRLEKAMMWADILHIITGYNVELLMAEAIDQQAVALYGSRTPDPQQAQQVYAQAEVTRQQTMVAQDQLGQANAEAGMPAQPMAAPPPPVPPPIFLPATKQDRIFAIWSKMLLANQFQLSPEQVQYLQFRACVDAYKLLADQQMMQQAMAAAGPQDPNAAPGQNGAQPGLDFASGPNPPNSPNPPVAPGVGVQS